MLENVSGVSGLFAKPGDGLETLLLVGCILVWLGYLALRYSRRLQIPVVTAFLLLGIALGPSGLNFVNASMMDSLRIVEPVALGMIAFAAGERLRVADLVHLSRRQYAAISLETVLPVALVGVGAYLVTGRVEVALPIAAIAGTTGLATVISTLKESGAKGSFTKMLGTAVATDNVFAVLFFSLTLPLVVAMGESGSVGSLYLEGFVSIVASIVIGLLAGLLVSRSIGGVRSSHELSMFALAYVLLVVGIAEFFHFSVLLAGLSMGTAAVNLTKEERDRDRVFGAMGPLEYPVYSIFFLWAGASLHVRALGSIGWIFGVYLVGRALGKLAGPLIASFRLKWGSAAAVQFRSLGMGLLPQAGAAVGLAAIARDSLAADGELILATVLAAVVVFELVGPLGVHWAAKRAGEAREWSSIQPLTLDEAVKELEDRKTRVVVLRQSSGPVPGMDAPQRMAARLHGDLVEVLVTQGFLAPVEVTLETGTSPKDEGVNGDQTENDVPADPPVLVLDQRHLDGFFDVVKGLKPHVLFVSLPSNMRQLLGPEEALAERIGCPVFDLPVVESRRWVDAVSARLAVADEALAKVSSRFRKEIQPRLLSRYLDRNKEP